MTTEHPWKEETEGILTNKLRETSGDQMIDNLLDIEGVDKEAPEEVNRSRFDQLSKKHFRVLLDKEDPRWRLVYKMARLEKEGILKGEHFEHGLRADYLSEHQSIRRGFSRYTDHITITQLARTLANIEIGNEVAKLLNESVYMNNLYKTIYEPSMIGFRHQVDERGVTGSQETLWQFLLLENSSESENCLGRIGFNFHIENGKRIISISNIQGAHYPEGLKIFEEYAHKNFAEFLVSKLQKTLGDEYKYRGVRGRPENPPLYTMTFRKMGIPRYRVDRLYGKPYWQSFEEIFEDRL